MNSAIIEYLAKTFRIIVLVACIMLFIRTFVVEPGKVNGRSMENTYDDAELFLVNKFALLFREPQRGDVVQFYDPSTQKVLIKRVIGLPGEQIQISRGSVSVRDAQMQETLLSENYLKPNTITESATRDTTLYETIPQYEYFIMGDNRPMSVDSRTFGTIHRSSITGIIFQPRFLQ